MKCRIDIMSSVEKSCNDHPDYFLLRKVRVFAHNPIKTVQAEND